MKRSEYIGAMNNVKCPSHETLRTSEQGECITHGSVCIVLREWSTRRGVMTDA